MKKIILSLFILIITYSCVPSIQQANAAQKERMETWIGSHYSVMIQQWGAYTRTINDGAGGKIYIWENHYKKGSTTTPLEFFGTTIYSTSGGGIGVYYKDVFVNKDGIITRIQWGQR